MDNPLHLAFYPNTSNAAGISEGAVVYHYDQSKSRCVYSGITPQVTSTINAEEAIILSICQTENITPDYADFFDLQTHRSYDHLDPGDFKHDAIIPDTESPYRAYPHNKFHVTFGEAQCPPDIRTLFQPFIGDPISAITPHEARAFCFAPTNRHGPRLKQLREAILFPALEVIVDNEGRSDLLEAAYDNRWTVWHLDPKQFAVTRIGPDPYRGL